MSKQQKVALGLIRKPGDAGEPRKFTLTSGFWYGLTLLVAEVIEKGGYVSQYTSADGNAFAFAIKAGKDRRAYWVGPDDDPMNKLNEAYDDWGLSGLNDVLFREVERVASELALEASSGDENR
jgi:hypothetical protein